MENRQLARDLLGYCEGLPPFESICIRMFESSNIGGGLGGSIGAGGI